LGRVSFFFLSDSFFPISFFLSNMSSSKSMIVDDTLDSEAVAAALHGHAAASHNLHHELRRLEAEREAQHAHFRALLAAHKAALPPLEGAEVARLDAFLAMVGRMIRRETPDVAHVSLCVRPPPDGADGAEGAEAFQCSIASTWTAAGLHHWITLYTHSEPVLWRVRAAIQEVHEGPQTVPQDIKDALATEWHDTEDGSAPPLRGGAPGKRLVYQG
jgi:hypothetical protein